MIKVCSSSVQSLFSQRVQDGLNNWEQEFVEGLRGREESEFQGNDPLLYRSFYTLDEWEAEVVEMLLYRELGNVIEFCDYKE